MTDFVETLRLAEKAQEDIYFAKRNRELIEALHRRLATAHPAQPEAAQSGEGYVPPPRPQGE